MNVDVNVTNTPFEVSVDVTTTPYVVNVKNGRYVPAGGTTGQVLGKASNDDYDTEWITPSGGGGGVPVTTEGNLWQADALGAPVGVSTSEILQSKVPFEKSPVAPLYTTRQLFAWDSFQRANSLTLGTSDSGHEWVNIATGASTQERIMNKVAYPRQGDILAINTGFGSVGIRTTVNALNFLNGRAVIYIGKDIDNYYVFEIQSGGSSNPFVLRKKIGGVLTNLGLGSTSNFGMTGISNSLLTIVMNYYHGTTSFLHAYIEGVQNSFFKIDVSSDFAGTFPTDADVAFTGIGLSEFASVNTSIFANFYDVQITKLML